MIFVLLKKITGAGSTRGARTVRSLFFFALLIVVLTGCQRAMSVLFDIPQKPAPTSAATISAQPLRVGVPSVHIERPPIEEILVADSVVALLPRDHAGNIDWMAALRDGTIKPRDSISEATGPAAPETDEFNFGFDFHFRGPVPTFDAYFPHSAHTQWINCQQCHGPIFKYRDTEFQMADVLAGKYCGECHGKVSFPPITACERCHQDLPQPPDRAQPLLLGTIRMTRVERGDDAEVAAVPDSVGMAGEAVEVLISESSLPPAVFPHWVHRIRFTCKACHMDLFEPKAGANAITMQDISAGEACGACHNGTVAFNAGFGECQRCHTPLVSEAP